MSAAVQRLRADAAQLQALRHDALSLRAPLVEDFERLDSFLQAVARATP